MKNILLLAILTLSLAATAIAEDGAYVVTLKPTATVNDSGDLATRLARTYGGAVDRVEGDAIVMRVSESRARLLAADPNVQSVTVAADGRRPSGVATEAINWSGGVDYAYDGSGNIRTIGTDTFSYDVVGRLVSGQTAGVTRTYGYDAFGNRTSCQEGGVSCQNGDTVSATSNRLQAPVGYDAAGNVSSHGGHTYAYDELHMQTSDQYGSVTREYIYTPDDERIGVLTWASSGSLWRWTVREPSGRVLREFSSQGEAGTSSWKWEKDYIWRDNLLLATIQPDVTGTGTTTYHYHLDHLGTPRRVTDDGDRIVGVHDYHAFGPEASGGTNEPSLSLMKYTGHERDVTGGSSEALDYMHARYYSPGLGRFLSVDPVLDMRLAMTSPQGWNRYAYVRSNPINKIDPNGAYEQDVHQGLTYALARAAGFSGVQSLMIARADQGVDEDPNTEPFSSRHARDWHHFTTQGLRDRLWSGFESLASAPDQLGAVSSLGVFLHAQQDSFSHAGFGSQRGHVLAGHGPDKTYNDPAKALTMAADTYRRLNAAADRLGISKTDRVAWKQIRSALVRFNLARSQQQKDLALKRLRDTIEQNRQ